MHGVEIHDSHAKMCVNGQRVQLLCLPAWEGDNCMHVRMFFQWCVHAMSCCCKGFVEDYRDLLELICEACNVRLGSPVVEA